VMTPRSSCPGGEHSSSPGRSKPPARCKINTVTKNRHSLRPCQTADGSLGLRIIKEPGFCSAESSGALGLFGLCVLLAGMGLRTVKSISGRGRCPVMRAGHSVLAALISVSGLVAQNNANFSNPQNAVLSWYPLQVGNSWTWENEALDGDIAHPTFERWTMEETIVSVAPDAELGGTLVTRRDRVLSDVMSPGFIPANNAARNLPPESHLLIYGNCVYILDGGDVGSAKIAPGYVTPAQLITTNSYGVRCSPTSVSL